MSAEFKNISVQLEPQMLAELDRRAASMDLNRSQYLRRLMRRDLGIATPDVGPLVPGLAQDAARGDSRPTMEKAEVGA